MKSQNQKQLKKQQAKARRLKGYAERQEFLQTTGCLDGKYTLRFRNSEELGETFGLPDNCELREYEFRSIIDDSLMLADLTSAYARRGMRIDEVKALLERGCRIVSIPEFTTFIKPLGILTGGEIVRRAIAPGAQTHSLSIDEELQLQETMEQLIRHLVPMQQAMFERTEIVDDDTLDDKPARQRHWGL